MQKKCLKLDIVRVKINWEQLVDKSVRLLQIK